MLLIERSVCNFSFTNSVSSFFSFYKSDVEETDTSLFCTFFDKLLHEKFWSLHISRHRILVAIFVDVYYINGARSNLQMFAYSDKQFRGAFTKLNFPQMYGMKPYKMLNWNLCLLYHHKFDQVCLSFNLCWETSYSLQWK